MKFYGHKKNLTVAIDSRFLGFVNAILDERGLISEPEKTIRMAGPDVFAIYNEFAPAAEITEALREAHLLERDTVVLEAVTFASAEEEAAELSKVAELQAAIASRPPKPAAKPAPAPQPTPSAEIEPAPGTDAPKGR